MLVLDSEALSALAHNRPIARRDAVRACIAEARRREYPVATVTAVLAEVVRGRRTDAAVFSAISRERVEPLNVDTKVAVRAGALLGAVRSGSEMAVDAFVVAAAEERGGGVIATVDPRDIRRLTAHAQNVFVDDIS